MKAWIVTLSLACGAAAASAAPIYRCGGGTYSQTPCPGGTIVESTDPRSAAQRAEARRIAAEERRKARAMERERRAAEKAAAREPNIASLGPEKAASDADEAVRKKNTKKGRKPEAAKDFTAVAPKKPD